MKLYNIKEIAEHFDIAGTDVMQLIKENCILQKAFNLYDLEEFILLKNPKKVVLVKSTETFHI